MAKEIVGLVDADIVAYVSAAVNGTRSISNLQALIRAQISKWLENLKVDRVEFYLSGDNNFRKDIYPEYKAHRTERPPMLAMAKHILANEYEAISLEKLEADDLIGIEHTNPNNNYTTIIVSKDKDFYTVPGLYFNPDKHTEPELVTPEQADDFYLMQVACGDRTDNYNGIRGLSTKTWEKLKEKINTLDKLKEYYLSKNYTEEYFTQMCRCAKILTYEDVDINTYMPKWYTK